MNKNFITIKFLFIFILLISFLPNISYAEIIDALYLNTIQPYLKKAKTDSLVIFDVDEVLVTPKDQILNPHYKDALRTIGNQMMEKHTHEEQMTLWGIFYASRKMRLVDSDILPVLQDLQKRGVKTIALTLFGTGKRGKIRHLEDFRIKELARFGIDFSHSFSEKGPIILGAESPQRKGLPLFKDGIIFTTTNDKGTILGNFFKAVNYKPNEIYFIDDKMDNLKSVEKFCQENNIQFIGFHYSAAMHHKVLPLNMERAKLQFEIFEKEHKWLNDMEVDKLLKKPVKP